MIRWLSLPLAMIALPAAAAVFTGEVESTTAQPIFTPPSNSSPVALRYFVPDGTVVKKGDVVLRIDAGDAAAGIRKLDAQIEQAQTKSDKEVAELRLKAMDAELLLIDAQAALEVAKVDASLPRKLISALDYDRHQTELERATHDAVLKKDELDGAREAAERRARDGNLEVQKLRTQRTFYQVQVEASEVRAERDGTVVHAFGAEFGEGGRFEEGSSAYPGQKTGEIVGAGDMRVHAWALAPDVAALKKGAPVSLAFDALPGMSAKGTIAAIGGAPEEKKEWSDSRYFTVDIDIDKDAKLPFMPGMSVRVETQSDPHAAMAQPAQTGNAVASGEVFAHTSVSIVPPQIQELWQMTITQMAADGQPVKQGDIIVTFDGGETNKKLMSSKSELEEKRRAQEKLRLELAEKARNEALTTSEAVAETEKARRKASEPPDAVPGIDYKKLIIARVKAEHREAASRERERVAADERAAEQRLADADVTRLTADVDYLQKSIAALQVHAPRDGVFLHVAGWDGDKIDVGKQV